MVIAQCSVPHQRGDVDGWPCRIDCGDIGSECRILKNARVPKQIHRVRRVAHQPHRCRADAAVSNDDRGHSLRQLRQHLRRADHVCIIVSMHIDESRCQHETRAIDDFPCGVIKPRSDRTNAITRDGHIKKLGLGAAAIDHARISNQSVADLHKNCLQDIRNDIRNAHRSSMTGAPLG